MASVAAKTLEVRGLQKAYRLPGGRTAPAVRDFTLRMKIKSESPVAVAILQAKPSGGAGYNNMQLTHTEGDSYEAVIPGPQAKGTVEYFIAAKNAAG